LSVEVNTDIRPEPAVECGCGKPLRYIRTYKLIGRECQC
jgi:hypothetical protein